MILPENIIKFLFELPDEVDITDQMNAYYNNILLGATQAIEIFVNAFPDQNITQFQEYSLSLNNNFEGEKIADALSDLKILRELDQFEEIFKVYLDGINRNLIKTAYEGNEELKNKFSDYLESIEEEYLLNYIKFIDTVEQIEGTKPIEEPEADIQETI